jgi:hypothetical protein
MVGAWQTTQTPVRYRFQPAVNEKGELVGRLDVQVGQDKLVDHAGWLAVGAEAGIERDAAEALQVHKEFGSDFWMKDHEPGTLYPRPQDTRAAIRKASVALDVETLERMIAEAQDALGLIQEMVDAQAEAQAKGETPAGEPAAKAKPGPKPKAAA